MSDQPPSPTLPPSNHPQNASHFQGNLVRWEGSPKVVALAGGVGGAKLAHGLALALPPECLTIIGNTGDDLEYYGLHVSPDLDTVMYTLAGIAHPVNGWGLQDDTRQTVGMLQTYGEPGWFGVGDRDMATSLLRTQALRRGDPLSQVTRMLCERLNIAVRLIPMSDQRMATMVETAEHGVLGFQEYFVRHRWQPVVKRLWFDGADQAQPAPGIIEAIEQADLIVLCPSNPMLSIDPILSIGAIHAALDGRRAPVIAVSPIIGGKAVKGPAAKLMAELGYTASSFEVARYYADLVDGFVIDQTDANNDNLLAERIEQQTGQHVLTAQTLMQNIPDRESLARAVVKFAEQIRR